MTRRRWARINVKALVILVVVVGLLGVGAFAGHHIRKRVMARNALVMGKAALAEKDWETAARHLRRYLRQWPDDVDTLEVYARTCLKIRPRKPDNVAASIAGYRRLLRHRRGDDKLSDRLAKLYLANDDPGEAAHICRQRLEVAPGDATATVLLGRALMQQSRYADARRVLTTLVNEQHPDEDAAYGLLSRIELESGAEASVEAAQAWLDKCVEVNADQPWSYMRRALFHRQIREDAAAALADLRRVAEHDIDDPFLMLLLAREFTRLNALDRAGRWLERAAPDGELVFDADANQDEYAVDWYLVAADLAVRHGDEARMVGLVDRALDELPDRHLVAFLPTAVEININCDRLAKARDALQRYAEWVDGLRIENQRAKDELTLLRGRLRLAEDHPYDTINLLRPMVDWNPRNVAVWRTLAEAYIRTNQSRMAVYALEECVQRRPGDVPLTMKLVREYLKQRKWAKALHYARTCEPSDQSNIQLRLLRLEAQLRTTAMEAADRDPLSRLRAELNALRERHPRVTAVRLLQAAVAEAEQRFEDAERVLRVAIEECDETLDASLQLASLLVRRSRVADALQVCREAVASHPRQAVAYVQFAELFVQTDREAEAEEVLTEALQRDLSRQQRRDIRLALARLYLTRGDMQQGIAVLEELAVEEPSDVAPRVTLLYIPQVIDDKPRAQQIIDDLQRIEGQLGLQWRLHQARLWLHHDELRAHEQQMTELLNDCIQADPQWPQPVILLGRMYTLLGDERAAERVYRQSLAVNASSVEIVDRLLRLLEGQNRFAEAKELLDRMPADRPELEAHAIGLAIGRGAFDEAIRDLELRVATRPEDAGARILLARLLYRHRGGAARALKLLDEAEGLEGESLTVTAIRASILFSEGRMEDAEQVLDEQVAQRDDFGSLLLRAQFNAARGNQEAAERDFRRLTQLEENAAAGYELLGRFLAGADRMGEAIEAWRRGLAADPQNDAIRRVLMKALLSLPGPDRRAEGKRMLGELQAEHPDDPDLLGVEATLLLRDGSPESLREAERVLRRVVELDGRAVNAQLSLIQMLAGRGELEEASRQLTVALGQNRASHTLLLAGARLERAQGHYARARELARSAVEESPGYVAAHLFLFEDAFTAGDYDGALAILDEVEQLAPDHPDIHLKRAAVLDAVGKRDEAVKVLEDYAAREGADNPLAMILSAAELYCRSGEYDTFERRLAEAEDIAPGAPEIYRARLQCLAVRGACEEMLSEASAYLAERPGDSATLNWTGSLLASVGEDACVREAGRLFLHVAETVPDDVTAHLGLAQVAYLQQDWPEVEKAYRRALQVDPDNARALNDLAWIMADRGGDLEEARRLVDRGITRHPADPHLRDTRGVILTKLELYAEAVRELRSASAFAEEQRRFATQARALIHLAEAYKLQGRMDRARARLNEARKVNREHDVLSDEESARIAELEVG